MIELDEKMIDAEAETRNAGTQAERERVVHLLVEQSMGRSRKDRIAIDE